MLSSISQGQKDAAAELLKLPLPDLYAYYLDGIASPYVMAKTERGKKWCFNRWVAELKEKASVEVKA